MNFWINSNTGDYIQEIDGVYTLTLLSRMVDGQYLHCENVKLTPQQFSVIKGFIPIKQKKLFSRGRSYPNRYAPTATGGVRGKAERVSIPTVAEARDIVLKELGI